MISTAPQNHYLPVATWLVWPSTCRAGVWAHRNGTWVSGANANSAANGVEGGATETGFSGLHRLGIFGRAGALIGVNAGQDPTYNGYASSTRQYAPENGIGRFMYPVPKGFSFDAGPGQSGGPHQCADNSQCDGVCLLEQNTTTLTDLVPTATLTLHRLRRLWGRVIFAMVMFKRLGAR